LMWLCLLCMAINVVVFVVFGLHSFVVWCAHQDIVLFTEPKH